MKTYLQQYKAQLAMALVLVVAMAFGLIDPTAGMVGIAFAGVSTAISAQGTTLKAGTTSGAKTITAITKANPGVFTAAAHAFVNGDIVALAAVVGMVEVNGRAGVVQVLSASTFSIIGLDTTNATTYTSGGTATPTQLAIANVRTIQGFDGQRNDIDVTNLDSLAEEIVLGIARNGQATLEVDIDDTNQGHMVLQSAQKSPYASRYVMTLPNGKTRTFQAFCKQYSENAGVDQVHRGNVTLRITGDVVRA